MLVTQCSSTTQSPMTRIFFRCFAVFFRGRGLFFDIAIFPARSIPDHVHQCNRRLDGCQASAFSADATQDIRRGARSARQTLFSFDTLVVWRGRVAALIRHIQPSRLLSPNGLFSTPRGFVVSTFDKQFQKISTFDKQRSRAHPGLLRRWINPVAARPICWCSTGLALTPGPTRKRCTTWWTPCGNE